MLYLVQSQNPTIKVTYNSKSYSILYSDLNVSKLKAIFKIQELECLEDLSGNLYYPYFEGNFPPSISSEVLVRQVPPKTVPVSIYPSESKFLIHTFAWSPSYTLLSFGYHVESKNMRITFLQFKDLSAIDRKRKVSKVYVRMVGSIHYTNAPVQVFTHRIETDWQGIINWNQQPIYKEEPYSSRILREVNEVTFYWDVTDIVLDWVSGALPNYGIALKTNNTYGIWSCKEFNNYDPVKKPHLVVYYE